VAERLGLEWPLRPRGRPKKTAKDAQFIQIWWLSRFHSPIASPTVFDMIMAGGHRHLLLTETIMAAQGLLSAVRQLLLPVAIVALLAGRGWSARPEGDEQTATSPAASSGPKDTRLTLKDIKRLREQGIAPERIVEKVAEQGRAFDVTAEVAEELRRRGFLSLQIDAIKESSPDPLVPGKWLTTSDEQRNRTFQMVKQLAAKSKVDIEPIQSQHVTLWAAKDI
jgi:hypothetical protein